MSEVVVRWTFVDPETSETWTVPVNPNHMSSVESTRNIKTAYGSRRLQNRIRTIVRPPSITEMTFGGVIYTEDHYETLVSWSKKTGPIRITDHLGRTFEVIMKAFDPKDRRPKPGREWRLTYEMHALVLGRIS